MIRALDLGDDQVARAVITVQRAAYAVEAELIGYDGIPPLHESLAELRACPESWLGAFDGAGLAGAVAYERLPDATLEICRLVVAPRAFRRGVATALLDALDAREPAERAVVSTATANVPALNLYRRRGFVPVEEVRVGPGVSVTRLCRLRPAGEPAARISPGRPTR